MNKLDPAVQMRLWRKALGPSAASLNGMLDTISGQFRLSAETIFTVAGSSLAESAQNSADPEKLWSACRSVARPRLQDLAERVGAGSGRMAGWDDLILPELQKQTLHQMALQSRHRMKVYETWGFAERGRRGLGLSALFAGPSGTGKTLAAEVLAAELKPRPLSHRSLRGGEQVHRRDGEEPEAALRCRRGRWRDAALR